MTSSMSYLPGNTTNITIIISNTTSNSDHYVDTFLPTALIWAVLSILAVVENVAVCVLIGLTNSLRTTTNLFVVSLCISDVMCAVIVPPMSILVEYFPTHTMFLIFGYSVGFAILAATFNLGVVALHRYVAVTRPWSYRLLSNKQLVLVIVIFGWLAPLIIDLIPLAWNTDSLTLQHKVYLFIYVIGCIMIPCFFMTLAYCRLFCIARGYANRMIKTRSNTMKRQTLKMRKDAKAAGVFSSVLIMFLVCWMPIILLNMAEVFEFILPDLVLKISMYTFLANLLLNPVIFALFKQDINRELKTRFWCEKKSRKKSLLETGTVGDDEEELVEHSCIVLNLDKLNKNK